MNIFLIILIQFIVYVVVIFIAHRTGWKMGHTAAHEEDDAIVEMLKKMGKPVKEKIKK